AAEEGHSQIVQKLVHSGTDANVRDMEGMTALHRASANGHVDIVRFLACVPGIIVSSPDANHSTALHLAAHSGHARVVALLL
ncbi:ankyrin repeat protein, partial [Tirmania nivea]